MTRPGAGNDLLALRRYQRATPTGSFTGRRARDCGSSWSGSSRPRAPRVSSCWLETPPGGWPREEQFELLCRLAATLAEDLFTAGRLNRAAVNAGEPIAVRRVRDLESFLDHGWRWWNSKPAARLARSAAGGAPAASVSAAPSVRSRRNIITFAPEGSRGVAAYVDGEKTATA